MPNGSGKSTLTYPGTFINPYINADNIQKVLCCSNEEAALIAEEKRHEAFDAGIDFSFETVLSTDRNLLLLQEAKDKGYFIKGYFILTYDPSVNIDRVTTRVESGGHGVPEEKIISRYYKSLANVPKFIEICDICHVFDNSKGPIRIYRKHKNQKPQIFPAKYWPPERTYKLVKGLNK